MISWNNIKRHASIRNISREIYDICFDVDLNIAGLNQISAQQWAVANSYRHSNTILFVLDYLKNFNKKKIKILNASGLGHGHQDFSILNYLLNNVDAHVEWHSIESPHSTVLLNDKFQSYIQNLGIKIKLINYDNKKLSEYGIDNDYDVILFTEIAEHLDHSTFLGSLSELKKRLVPDGLLIFSTPNMLSLLNRARFLIGTTEGIYWGDGPENLNRGLWGHIVMYDIKRIERLLDSIGLRTVTIETINCSISSSNYCFIKALGKLIEILSYIIPNSKQVILLTAIHDEAVVVPYKIS